MSFQGRLWDFLNTDLGRLVVGFVLTTLAGTILTTWYKRESKKHEVRFVQLHEERAEAIKILHDLTVDIERAFFDLKYSWMPKGLHPQEIETEEVNDKVREFRNLTDKYKVYFTEDLCKLTDSLAGAYESTWGEMENAIIVAGENGTPTFDLEKELKDKAEIRDAVKAELQAEFRKILGVE